jgi:starvation-inducible DNA-binding protein
MQPHIGLEKETRHRVIESLQHLLADEFVLYLKTRNFHWNVEGAQFYQLHKLFEAQYEEIDAIMDNVAERIRALGGYAAGSMVMFTKLASLSEVTGRDHADARMEALLLRDQETVIQSIRELIDVCGECGDAGTQDFVTGLMEDHEKMAWMLRSQRPCADNLNTSVLVEAALG